MPFSRMLKELDSQEIAEEFAYDLLSNEEYKTKLDAEMMTADQRSDAMMKMLGK